MPANTIRGERFKNILEKYKAEQLGESGPAGEEELIDLLTDIMHYCDAHDIDFPSDLEAAYSHHYAEVNGD